MDLRESIASVLASAWHLRHATTMSVELADGSIVTGRLTYDSAQEVVDMMAKQLIANSESIQKGLLSNQLKQERRALMEEFGIKAD
jgi:polyhydroxyalkanoate synthesis regulator phasin